MYFGYVFDRWRELLPEVVKNINDMPKVMVHGVCRSGNEYRSQCIQNLLSQKWPETSLTIIASMFRLVKFKMACDHLMNLNSANLKT